MPARPPVTEHVASKQEAFHADIVGAVAEAVATHDVVVVGMSVNPHVRRARAALDAAGIAHHDLDFGGYHNMWRPRLALKIWAGWPTFPQVFVKGRLIGGASETEHMLKDGSFADLLAG